MNLKKKNILVIGGSSGIGRGIADCFVNYGAKVCITGTKESLNDYDTDISENISKCDYRKLDLSDHNNLDNFDLPFEDIDHLICSQGIVAYKRKEFQLDTFKKVVDLNLNSIMASCTFFHKQLSKNNGSIIIIGSGASYHSVKGNPAYSASKGGLLTLIKTLAEAWAEDKIRVNGIAPGFVATKLTEVTYKNEERYEGTLQRIPLGRWGKPEDMGELACFLCSDKASYITGQMITVDGGMGL
ncbi:MAG: SDR family oxidoreductase [Pseudomonadota bacterium]|nr:SDR family oxidoreductase [Pseudomonadota bacterium]MEC9459555.1 SDR family oxidoreductase [Pseudomonadota bacterium]|tara:strand:+ start:1135 stop:1860 length:726 start_codon:yes stop_codon:yes gene_type:complete